MASSSVRTTTMTVRILRTQAEALERLPAGETPSSLIRNLLSLYLDNKIPEVPPLQASVVAQSTTAA